MFKSRWMPCRAPGAMLTFAPIAVAVREDAAANVSMCGGISVGTHAHASGDDHRIMTSLLALAWAWHPTFRPSQP